MQRAGRHELHRHVLAGIAAPRAARTEGAPLRKLCQVRRLARDLREPAPRARLPRRGERAEEPDGVRVGGRPEQLGRGGVLDHVAGVHDGHRVAVLRDDSEIVRDEDHGHSELVLQLREQREDLILDRHVERGRRLIGEQQLRPARDRDRDHHALPHPAAQLVRVRAQALLRRGDPDVVEQLDRARTRLAPAHAELDAQRLRDLLADREDGIEAARRVLEDHRDLAAPDRAQLARRESEQVASPPEHLAFDDPSGLRHDPEHRAERDALAGARFADDALRGALLDVEADAVRRKRGAVRRRERGV